MLGLPKVRIIKTAAGKKKKKKAAEEADTTAAAAEATPAAAGKGAPAKAAGAPRPQHRQNRLPGRSRDRSATRRARRDFGRLHLKPARTSWHIAVDEGSRSTPAVPLSRRNSRRARPRTTHGCEHLHGLGPPPPRPRRRCAACIGPPRSPPLPPRRQTCRTAQTRTLLGLLALNGDSRFSRDHRLDGVRTVSQFRRRLPVADYEYFRPYIEEVKAGRTDSLLGPKNRLLMFSLTSGTTSQSKYIPITERFLSDYRSGWQVWGIQAIDAHPGINSRHILQFSSDYDLFRTPGGTPCGNISGLVAACQKPIVRTMYTVPGIVSKIRDSDSKLYTAMRLAIADRHVGMVMTANPSTLIQLAKLADARKEDLIRDIADGTLSSAENVPGEVREALGAANWPQGTRPGPRARSHRRSHRHALSQRLLARG